MHTKTHSFVRSCPFVICCCISLSAIGTQQAEAQNDPEVLRAFQNAQLAASEGKLLKAIDLVEAQSSNHEFAAPYLGTLYSFVGDWKKANDLRSPAQKNNHHKLSAHAKFIPAIDRILKEATKRQIVMINESHDSPQHRAFILELAKELRTIGFEYYAMEALAENAEQLKMRGYPVMMTGLYTSEPAFGDLIRHTLKDGYIPVAYEAPPGAVVDDPIEGINARESKQCTRLIEQVLSRNPHAKLLVHVGFDHVMETPKRAGDSEILWLAARLKQATKLDPLTIDQTTELQLGARSGEVTAPVLVSKENGKLVVDGHYKGFVDLQVFHPEIRSREGRPDWLFRSGERMPVTIRSESFIGKDKSLVKAYYLHESEDAVPADQFVLTGNKPFPVLALRPGHYRIVTQDSAGNELSRIESSVR